MSPARQSPPAGSPTRSSCWRVSTGTAAADAAAVSGAVSAAAAAPHACQPLVPLNPPPSPAAAPCPAPAAIHAAFPQQQLVVFSGDLDAQQTIALFQRARVILGPHGAGLSHTLFAAPGTTGTMRALLAVPLVPGWLPLLMANSGWGPDVLPSCPPIHLSANPQTSLVHHPALPCPAVVEFMFLADPPLMFWHTAATLGQQYWLLPVPQAYWLQEAMQAGHNCCWHWWLLWLLLPLLGEGGTPSAALQRCLSAAPRQPLVHHPH